MSADGADTTRTRSAPTDGEDVKVVLEQTLLTCPEVFVYRIPPMMTSGGHRAEDWNLAKPLETCSLVVMRRDDACLLRLLSEKPKKDGPPGATEPHLFCECQIQLDFGDPTKKLEHWVEAVVVDLVVLKTGSLRLVTFDGILLVGGASAWVHKGLC